MKKIISLILTAFMLISCLGVVAFAEGEAAVDTTQQGGLMQLIPTILMLVAMVAVFYFLMYRPQKKQEKEVAQMRDSLAVGDEITTIGGIIGEVVSIKDDTLVLETTKNGTRIRILRSAVKTVDVKAEDKQA